MTASGYTIFAYFLVTSISAELHVGWYTRCERTSSPCCARAKSCVRRCAWARRRRCLMTTSAGRGWRAPATVRSCSTTTRCVVRLLATYVQWPHSIFHIFDVPIPLLMFCVRLFDKTNDLLFPRSTFDSTFYFDSTSMLHTRHIDSTIDTRYLFTAIRHLKAFPSLENAPRSKLCLNCDYLAPKICQIGAYRVTCEASA